MMFDLVIEWAMPRGYGLTGVGQYGCQSIASEAYTPGAWFIACISRK